MGGEQRGLLLSNSGMRIKPTQVEDRGERADVERGVLPHNPLHRNQFPLVSDPLNHICTIYIFDPVDLVSFQQIPELPANSAADSQEKDRVQKHHKKGPYYMFRHNARLRKRRSSSPPVFLRVGEKPPPLPKWQGRREASSLPIFGSPAPQNTSQNPVFSSFQTLLKI